MRRAFAATAVVLALALAGPAHGEEDEPGDEPTGPGKPSYSIECAAPCLQYEGDFEIEYGGTRFKADGVTSHDVGPSVDTDLKYRPLDWLVVSGHFVTEPVLDLEPGDDRAFADIGAFAEELNVQLLFGDFQVIAGKFHPAFGLAWEIPPGLHATDLAGDYELDERLGLGIAVRFEALGLDHHAHASAFTVDRTFLSESLFTNRGRVTLHEGGAGNTDDISSLALALDACSGAIPKDCVDEGDWGYHFALLHQEGKHDEKGTAAALFKFFDLTEDARLTLFGELAYFSNFDASPDDALFFTATGIVDSENLLYSLTYSRREVDEGDAHLFDALIDWKLGDRFSLAGEKWLLGPGYAFIRDNGEDSHIFAVHLEAEIAKTWP